MAFLQEFLQVCSDDGTRVVVFLTPLHPEVIKHLSKTSNYQARKSSVLAMLQDQAEKYDVPVLDLTALESFGGTPDQFQDGAHPLEPNTRRMIDQITNAFSAQEN